MADNGRTSFPLHHTGINLAFISMRIYFLQELHGQPTSQEIVFGFLFPVIFDFLKLQCQGKGGASPFETHTKTMRVAIASFFMYGLGYYAEQRLSHYTRPANARVVRHGMVLFSWLSSVSLASILFPDSVGPVLYLLYVLFSAGELLCRRRRVQRNRGALLPL